MKFGAPISLLTLLLILVTACAAAPTGSAPGANPEATSSIVPLISPVPATRSASTILLQQSTRLYAADQVARLSVIAQLESDGSAEAIMILGTFFMDSNVPGRLEAARALLRINSEQSLNYIRTALTDRQLTSRRQVAMQALERDPENSYPILRLMLTDKDELVRLHTVQVLEFLGTPEGRALLKQAATDSSPTVQKAAIDALRGLGFVPSPTP